MNEATTMALALLLLAGCDGGAPPDDDAGPLAVDAGPGSTDDAGPGSSDDAGPPPIDAGGACEYVGPPTIDRGDVFFCVVDGCELRAETSTALQTQCDFSADDMLFSLTNAGTEIGVIELRILAPGDYVVSSTQGEIRSNPNPGNFVDCSGDVTTCNIVRRIPFETETTVETNRHRITFTFASSGTTYTVTELVAL